MCRTPIDLGNSSSLLSLDELLLILKYFVDFVVDYLLLSSLIGSRAPLGALGSTDFLIQQLQTWIREQSSTQLPLLLDVEVLAVLNASGAILFIVN